MRGRVHKRARSRPFKSVLSVDVQYGIRMPNLKISKQNTIQITGCCNMALLGAILSHLATQYNGRGFTVTQPACAGFVCDIVLSNVFFRMPANRLARGPPRERLDRTAVCTAFNNSSDAQAIATFEPLLNDASVSIKLFDREQPNRGYVYPWWSRDPETQARGWRLLNEAGFQSLLMSLSIRGPAPKERPICHTFRIFGSGSVVQVGRWPQTMAIKRQHVVSVLLSVCDETRRRRLHTVESCHEVVAHTGRLQGLKQLTLWPWLGVAATTSP